MRIGILGGGISGLALGHFLKPEHVVLEKESTVGGLCRTFIKDGFAYDQGGHIIFSKDQEVLDLEIGLLHDNVLQQMRKNVIWYKGRFVKYPFENGLSALDKDDIFDCLYHYLINPHPEPKNFEQWVYRNFGTAIADRYLLPYNRKIWKIDPSQMSMGWVERMPKPPLEDVIKSAIGIETEGYLHQLYFFYPKVGGFESLVQAFARKVKNIETGILINKIKFESGAWIVSNGPRNFSFDRLISTIPLHDLASALGDVPAPIRAEISKLRYNKVLVAMIGVRGDYLTGKSAVYIPDPDCLAHRICFNGYFSPAMTPAGCSSLIAEITCRPGDALDQRTDADILHDLIHWLSREKFLKLEDIIVTDLKRVEYGYPVYDLDYEKRVENIRNYFRQERKIELCGRFAEHLYINSDVCIRRAWDLAKKFNEA